MVFSQLFVPPEILPQTKLFTCRDFPLKINLDRLDHFKRVRQKDRAVASMSNITSPESHLTHLEADFILGLLAVPLDGIGCGHGRSVDVRVVSDD